MNLQVSQYVASVMHECIEFDRLRNGTVHFRGVWIVLQDEFGKCIALLQVKAISGAA